MSTWTRDATMVYLNANPLPATLRWHHRDDPPGVDRPVMPSHSNVRGYGKWLRETPYFQGLFELAHAILEDAADLGDADWLAREIQARAKARAGLLGQLPATRTLFDAN